MIFCHLVTWVIEFSVCIGAFVIRLRSLWFCTSSDLSSLPDGRSIACPIRMSLHLLYIQLLFSVYLTCKWKGAVSYHTRPGTGFTGSGTIFSLATTAGKFNRERLFWSLYEVSSNFTADMLLCFVSPSLCKFYNNGSRKQGCFSLPDSSPEHSNSWPEQHWQKSVSKMNF